MKNNFFHCLKFPLAFTLLIGLYSCDTDDSTESTEPELYQKSGVIITSSTSTDPVTYFAGYFEEIPTGNLDLVANAASYDFFRADGIQDGFMYGRETNFTGTALVKYAVDIETQDLVKVDELILDDFPGRIVFIDNETAVVNTFNGDEKDVFVFNPQTMMVTKKIDLSRGVSFPNNTTTQITSLIYNEQLGKIYALVYTDLEATPQFYDEASIYVEVIDANTLEWEKTIVHPNAEYVLFRGETNAVIDESGNTYLVVQGQYGIDLVTKGDLSSLARPKLLKINTNSEFDTDYTFNPITAYDPALASNFAQLFTSMIYAGNNRAYAIGSGTVDDPVIKALLEGFANGEFTDGDPQYNQLVGLVLASPSSALLEIDLLSKSVTKVPGVPLFAGYSNPFMYEIDGEFYINVISGATSSYYKIDAAGSASEAFTLTTGGNAFQILDLSK